MKIKSYFHTLIFTVATFTAMAANNAMSGGSDSGGISSGGTSSGEMGSSEKSDSASSFTEILSGFETLQGNFVQKIKDPDGKLVQETEGEFKVKRPGYFLWEIAPPYEQVVAGTPDKLKIYDPDLEQLTVHDNDSLEGSPALLISGDVKAIAAQYDIEKNKKSGAESFTLRNKVPDESSFASMTFTFKKKGKQYVLESMNFVDKLGQTTEVMLAKVKTNVALKDKVFQFEAPAGTDIIVNN